MAWLPAWGSTSKPEGASSTSETAGSEEYRPPGRQTRAKCWDSRDVFNECLNRNNILDAIKDKDAADKACGKESDLFEKNCASSWVSSCKSLIFSSTRKNVSPLLSRRYLSGEGEGEVSLRTGKSLRKSSRTQSIFGFHRCNAAATFWKRRSWASIDVSIWHRHRMASWHFHLGELPGSWI